MDLENSVGIDSENYKVESPEEVIEIKRGKCKISLDKDKDVVKEPVRKVIKSMNDFTYAWKSTVISWITIISKHDARDGSPK